MTTRLVSGWPPLGAVMLGVLLGLGPSTAARAAEDVPRWMGTYVFPVTTLETGRRAGSATLILEPTFVYLARSRWSQARIVEAAHTAASLLQQCDVTIRWVRLHLVDGPERYADFHVPAARDLVRRLPYPKPTVYFVRDTRQRIAFDAEAIGRGNSASRPELQDTVWITEAVRDPGIALAHELVHVLMDSGEHVDLPRNLMRDETAAENRELTPEQCARLRATGQANGLLKAAGRPRPAGKRR
ncbi:MAG: hypothetical protein DI596_12070 [Azospira oryzae]|nr:MAG: hypothetical protein DI596_12070 [Azospira oryzae]PZP77629.1 MAG: hypothetical protein DI593_12070 [Azospira oryzae]